MSESERQIREVFESEGESAEGMPVIVFLTMDALSYTWNRHLVGCRTTIVPQFLWDRRCGAPRNIDRYRGKQSAGPYRPRGTSSGAVRYQDRLSAGQAGGSEIFAKHLTSDLRSIRIIRQGWRRSGEDSGKVDRYCVEEMYSTSEENKFRGDLRQRGERDLIL